MFDAERLRFFTDRTDELEQLANLFKDNHQIVYIHGRSGCGKTTLAREYAYRIVDTTENYIVRFFDSDKFFFEFEQLALELNILKKNFSTNEDFIKKVKCKIDYYTEETKLKFLFVLDNVKESDECLKALSFDLNKNSEIMVTTKYPHFKNHYFKMVPMQLEPFDDTNCLHLLTNQHVHNNLAPNDWHEIFRLLSTKNKISVLPIRLVKLLSVINEHPLWEFNEIREHIVNKAGNIYGWLKSECGKAFELLSYFSFLNGFNINSQLIKSIFSDWSPSDLELALNFLLKNSEIVKNLDGGFTIHESTQCDVKCEIPSEHDPLLDKIVLSLNILMKEENLKNLFNSKLDKAKENLFYQSMHVLQHEWRSKATNKQCAELYVKVGIVDEKYFLKFQNSIDCYRKALEIYKSNDTVANNTVIADTIFRIAEINKDQGNYEQALIDYNESLDLDLAVLSEKGDLSIAKKLHNIGFIYDKQGKYVLSLSKYAEALRLKKELLPANHPDIGKTIHNIALVYTSLGKYELSLDHLYKAQASLPPNDPEEGSILNNIAFVLCKDGKYVEALSTFTKSLQLKQQTLHRDHPSIATTVHNIGLVYSAQGKYSQALECFFESLKIYKEALRTDHPSIGRTINNIGVVYYNQGYYDKALGNFNRALAIYKKELPDEHIFVSATFNNIGLVKCVQKKFDEALFNFDRSCETEKAIVFENHSDIGVSILGKGSVHQGQGDYAKAMRCFTEALDTFEQTLSISHPYIGNAHHNIASLYSKQQNYAQAILGFNLALDVYQKSLPHNHPDVARTPGGLGSVYLRQGKLDDSLAEFNMAFEIFSQTIPLTHPDVEYLLENIGAVKRQMNTWPYKLKMVGFSELVFTKNFLFLFFSLLLAYICFSFNFYIS